MWGIGRGWWWFPRITTSKGYTYIGPCRCGFGPHAFYQDSLGRIVHASQVYRWGYPIYEPADLKSELELLKEEKTELETRIKELEEKLKDKEK